MGHVNQTNVNITANSYNLSPNLTQMIANAVNQSSGMDMNSILAQQYVGNGNVSQTTISANMAQAFPGMSPNMAAAQTFSAKGIKKLGKKAKKLGKKGYPQSGLAGVLLQEGINSKKEAKQFEKRLLSDPSFRRNVEQRVGGKFIPDGKCADGTITFAPLQARLPGIVPNVSQTHMCCGQSGTSVLSGIAAMQGNAMQLMMGIGQASSGGNMAGLGGYGSSTTATLTLGGVGGGYLGKAGLGALSGMMGGGFSNTMGMQSAEWRMRSMFGMTKSQGGPGSRVGSLPAGASFEDIVAAFMTDTIDDMQKESMAKMDQIRGSINSSNAQGGVGGAKGALNAFGPLGALAGQQVGQAGGNASLGGNPLQGQPGTDKESRNLMFEELKNIMQKLQQMLQALSNVINTMHQGAMNSIRNIRA